MYVNLKLRLKEDRKFYAILGQTGNGGYRITPMEEAEQHGLVPRPWLQYRPETVRVVNEGEVESFLAYSVPSIIAESDGERKRRARCCGNIPH